MCPARACQRLRAKPVDRLCAICRLQPFASSMSNSGTGCVSCPSPDIVTCSCARGEPYSYIERSCSQCRQCICGIGDPSSDNGSSSGGGGSNVGVTAGGAIGGVLGIAAALFLLYWFWWKPKGLAASRKRYSRHLTQRQSKLTHQLQANEKKRLSTAAPGTRDDVASKRTSVHLSMAPNNDSAHLSRRMNLTSGAFASDGTTRSLAATGGHSTHGSTMVSRSAPAAT